MNSPKIAPTRRSSTATSYPGPSESFAPTPPAELAGALSPVAPTASPGAGVLGAVAVGAEPAVLGGACWVSAVSVPPAVSPPAVVSPEEELGAPAVAPAVAVPALEAASCSCVAPPAGALAEASELAAALASAE